MDLKNVLAVSILVSCVSLSACITSPAPGCSIYLIPGPTGCFGKTAITDVSQNPENNCLIVDVNNCQGGNLRITNNCDVNLDIVGMHIAAGQRRMIESTSLSEGKNIVIGGKLGTKDIDVSYSKRRYCD